MEITRSALRLCHVLVKIGDNSLVHELRVIAAVKLHLNVTYAQDPAFKSVDEKS